jgi:hypothetical protein
MNQNKISLPFLEVTSNKKSWQEKEQEVEGLVSHVTFVF